MSDFLSVRKDELYYIDKTMYLEELEKQPDTLIFIRPRRFGKSLFISMMRAYYDKAMESRFDELFGNLWVGKHPTPLRNKYQVMYFDYSRAGGTIERLEENFNEYSCGCIDMFIERYKADYPQWIVDKVHHTDSARAKLNLINEMAHELGIPLYLIIDEYDNFTNIVLNEEGEAMYHAITHANGFYRDFFKLFKGMFERIFLTGVSPVTLDDLTSGFNISWNVSMIPELDKMLGFSTEDVREMFTYYKEVGMLPAGCDIEAMIEEMKPWYDNYCFSKECLEDGNRVFNSDMVLFYLRNYMMFKYSPESMLDPNTKTDYNKLKRLIRLDQLDGNRKGILKQIAEKGEITSNIELSFPASDLIKPNKFISLLFYYGMLTIKGVSDLQLVLAIPNNNVRLQYYNFLMENYDEVCSVDTMELVSLYSAMGAHGNWHDALQYLCDRYKLLSSVRDSIEGERNIQGFFMAYLSLCSYYLIAPEMEFNHGYCDLFLMPNMAHYKAKHSYIIELKYLSKAKYTEESATKQWDEAVEQINQYAKTERVEAMRQGTRLHKIIIQFCGWDMTRMEEV